jgi:hypothetical protein
MSLSTEDVALKILETLKVEYDREPSLLKCRQFNDILTEVGNKYDLTQDQVTAAVGQLANDRKIEAVDGHPAGGKSALPSDKGLAFLAEYKATKRKKTEFTLDRGLALCGIIIAIIAIISTSQCSHQ